MAPTCKPRIIAEIGTAHAGDITRAYKLIRAAKDAGADTAKFQIVKADEILHPLSGNVDLPGGTLPLYERFLELERDASFYKEVMSACVEMGIRFLCTPFGIDSARTLHQLGVDEYKIASPELNHHPLVREIASYSKPIILSTGIARLRDIGETLDLIESMNPRIPIELLHCVTSYPAREEEYNLRVIPGLQQVFGVPVGISDHSMDPILVPSLATLYGAVTIEKHITLDRSDPGLDDSIALEPALFRRMVEAITTIASKQLAAVDDSDLHRITIELEESIRSDFSDDRVDAVLGDGIKRLATSETPHYGFTNRSIHAVRAIEPGGMLNGTNIALLRSEKNLTPGLHPRYWEVILQHTAKCEILAGEGLRWDHLL